MHEYGYCLSMQIFVNQCAFVKMASIKLKNGKNSALTGATSVNWIGSVRMGYVLFFVAYSAYSFFIIIIITIISFSRNRHASCKTVTHNT